MPHESPVIFFDLRGTLLQPRRGGWEANPAAVALLDGLSADTRLGVLANLGPGGTRADARRLLQSAGLVERFDPLLIVVASELPVPLPDRRAFAVAAALAEVPVAQCVYVSANPPLLLAAAAAGMRSFALTAAAAVTAPVAGAPAAAADGAAAGPSLLSAAPDAAAAPAPAFVAGATLLAGEIDEDTGPTFVLRGRVVTMDRKVGNDGVIDAGWVAIRKGKIAALGTAADALPDAFANAVSVDTKGTLYPGLMDLHNHLAYNVLPLWKVPKKYTNRGQWPRHAEYAPNVQLPINLLGAYAPTARSIVRYIECKALVGGTTAAQGVRSKQSKMTKLYRGAMRNLEETDDKRLPESGSKVLNYKRGDPKDTESFKSALAKYRAYFYHLSEGTDKEALSHFTDLVQNDLLGPALVGIHSLGLTPANLTALGARGGKIVWSPFSNLLLYGKTLDLKALRDSGTQFTLGCDWAPTGSKNLLQELKVARFESQRQGDVFSAEELVRAVTTSAAQVLGWDGFLGTLKAGGLADLVVIDGTAGDPYDLLIDATEADVRLVAVHGVPRYGDAALMKQLNSDPAHPPEAATIGGKEKAFALFAADAPLNDLTLASATTILTEAMADMRGFEQRIKEDTAHLLSFGMEADEGFVLELDNEFDPLADTPTAVEAGTEVDTGPELLGAGPRPQVAKKVDLDQIEVNTPEYWKRIDAQDNITADLKEMLKHAYR